MENKLAIVIPAFKKSFLLKTLQSIDKQTNKDFTLYIGDDASPENLQSIIDPFKNSININYSKFEFNLGGTSLIQQWKRCLDLCRNETWVWFFSDDDIMDSDCVEQFWITLYQTKECYDVYRFNTQLIGPADELIYNNPEHPSVETSNEFIRMRLTGDRISAACEYVFRLKTYKEKGGFVDFPRAWCSDDATWIKLASKTGIKTVQGPKVSWRSSNESVSGNKDDKKSKILALREYLIWSNSQPYIIKDNELIKKQKYWIFRYYFQFLSNVKIVDWIKLMFSLAHIHNDSVIRNAYNLVSFVKHNPHLTVKTE
jgi:glycosyltransferase involved in cell wall biosynthesis